MSGVRGQRRRKPPSFDHSDDPIGKGLENYRRLPTEPPASCIKGSQSRRNAPSSRLLHLFQHAIRDNGRRESQEAHLFQGKAPEAPSKGEGHEPGAYFAPVVQPAADSD